MGEGADFRLSYFGAAHHVAVAFIVGWPAEFAVHNSMPALVSLALTLNSLPSNKFSYRGLQPLFEGSEFSVNAFEQRLQTAIAKFLPRPDGGGAAVERRRETGERR